MRTIFPCNRRKTEKNKTYPCPILGGDNFYKKLKKIIKSGVESLIFFTNYIKMEYGRECACGPAPCNYDKKSIWRK